MYAVTGATGQLGRLVINSLLERVPGSSVAALVRNPDKAADLLQKGVVVRYADYEKPETLGSALEGVDKLVLISGSDIGKRVAQHGAVIDAAKSAGVKLIVYTSILNADASPLTLAEEHRGTEEALRTSGMPYVLLRNGWYNENYSGAVGMGTAHGAVIGAAGDGKISSASRRDFAEAAAVVVTSEENQGGKVYELAGDAAFSMTELAEEISRQAGKPVAYADMPQAEYASALRSAGLPEPVAEMLADSDSGVAKGWLHDASRTLSGLIGRPTTPISATVAEALKA